MIYAFLQYYMCLNSMKSPPEIFRLQTCWCICADQRRLALDRAVYTGVRIASAIVPAIRRIAVIRVVLSIAQHWGSNLLIACSVFYKGRHGYLLGL
jgi:hypothetical protein